MPSSVYRAKASKELQPRSVDMLCGLGNMLAIPGGSIEQLEGGVVCCMLHGVHTCNPSSHPAIQVFHWLIPVLGQPLSGPQDVEHGQ